MKKILTLLFALVFSGIFAQSYTANQKVMIKWNNDWFPGKIIEVRTNGYYISYDNYDNTWNEVVGTDRLKTIDGTSTPAVTGNTVSKPAPTKNTTPAATSGDPVTTKVDEYCKCIETANQTKKLADKEKCLDLKDAHLVALGDGSDLFYEYKRKITECKNNGATNATNDSKTFEEKVKAVCDCFEEAKKDKSKKPECFKLQGQYGGDYDGDDTIKFLTETNKCAG
ncbi:MAG: hypothetical protein IPG89_21020 [Bacteroidetes bacterium]|nr:hypothetical protein [Bacteroidota bacterium]